MGKPIDFPESNTVWRGWPEDGNHAAVLDLPAWRGNNFSISCWRLSWRERLRVLFTGRAWLRVAAKQHPPVHISGLNPFDIRSTDCD